MSLRNRLWVTVVVALVLTGAVLGWMLTRPQAVVEVDPAVTLRGPGLLVRDTTTGHLAVVAADGSRRQSKAECARSYAAGATVLCLQTDPDDPRGFQLDQLNDQLDSVRSFPINGVPTRTRVSADGRILSWTVFVSGDSYTSTGLSTRSGIYDTATGVLADSLEDFTVDGRKPATDANFWGVSFAGDDNTFYATMATKGHFYLVRGSFAEQTLTVVGDGVECPSLSPDETRVVYKKRLPDRSWQLWVLNLTTGQRTQLAEKAAVDDQGAWLDNDTVAYAKLDAAKVPGVWSVPADGTGSPTLLAEHAESPAVLPVVTG